MALVFIVDRKLHFFLLFVQAHWFIYIIWVCVCLSLRASLDRLTPGACVVSEEGD